MSTNSLTWDINKEQLPNELIIGDQYFELDWQAVVTNEQTIGQVILVIRDSTKRREAELAAAKFAAELEDEKKILSSLIKMSAKDLDWLKNFLQSSFLQEDFNYGSKEAMIHDLHTLKGIFRTIDAPDLANTVHHLEETINIGQNPRELWVAI